jgi:hypothetical protein
MKENQDLLRAKRIEQQVEKWDLFAKIVPTIFLVACFLFLVLGIVDVETVFYVGLVFFALTAATWWFWTIYSIRFLVRLLGNTSHKLLETGEELQSIRTEYKELRNDENHNS